MEPDWYVLLTLDGGIELRVSDLEDSASARAGWETSLRTGNFDPARVRVAITIPSTEAYPWHQPSDIRDLIMSRYSRSRERVFQDPPKVVADV